MALLKLVLKHTRVLTEQHLVSLLIAGYTINEQLVMLMNWMLRRALIHSCRSRLAVHRTTRKYL